MSRKDVSDSDQATRLSSDGAHARTRPVAITLKNVSCRYNDMLALAPVDLEIVAGSFVALVGPSGCGKTTLLRLVADLTQPTTGSVLIDRDPPAVARRKRILGLVSQRPAVLPWKRAIDDVSFTQKITGRRSLSPQRLLREFGLSGHEEKHPQHLSGGMLQRVNLASAIAHDPAVLLMDEPFSALDEMSREDLGLWLGETLAASPKTVLFVTHHIDEAVMLADRIIVLSPGPGRVIADIPVTSARPRDRSFRTDPAFIQTADHIRTLLASTAKAAA